MKISVYDYSVNQDRPELLRQWNSERNGELRPRDISQGSHKEVWWKCEKGHEWRSKVFNRTYGAHGCPFCAGKRVLKGFNDLATCYPEIAKTWNTKRNKELTPEEVTFGSQRKVWWECERGHEWATSVCNRVYGTGCPVCAGKITVPGVNDLKTTNPDLARQWHYSRNGALTPDRITAGSPRRVWWQCGQGHEWQASIGSRAASGAGCPVCAGKKVVPGENDLLTTEPDLMKEWDWEANRDIDPKTLSAGMNKYVWWKCEKGHSWRASVHNRAKGSGCPYCANKKLLAGFNDLATTEPEVATEWHPTLNGEKTPQMFMRGSRNKVWWQCSEGHSWQAAIFSRTGGRRSKCPVCAGRAKNE